LKSRMRFCIIESAKPGSRQLLLFSLFKLFCEESRIKGLLLNDN
jgi:hypothetical protein